MLRESGSTPIDYDEPIAQFNYDNSITNIREIHILMGK